MPKTKTIQFNREYNGMITEIKGKCQFKRCQKKATAIACGRKKELSAPGVYCEHHAVIVEGEDNPEGVDCCPNCGCRFGIN